MTARYLTMAIVLGLMTACPESPRAAASLRSVELQESRADAWIGALGYRSSDLRPITLSTTGCPFVEALLGGKRVSLLLDTGMAHGFLLTDRAPRVPFHVERTTEELNADGSHRGESKAIRVDSMEVLGERFMDVEGTYADWRLYSSVPFEGAVGLDYFAHRRFTLDFPLRRLTASSAPLPSELDSTRHLVLDLVRPPESQGRILYFRAVVNGRAALVYLDTGRSASWIDPGFVTGLSTTVVDGRKVCRDVPIVVAGRSLVLDNLRVEPLARGEGFDQPVALALGSDILSHLVVTIDVRAEKLVLTRSGQLE